MPEAVENGRGQEPPEILSQHPDQGRYTPGDEIDEKGHLAAAKFISNDPAHGGRENLEDHADRQDQSDLLVLDAQGIHIERDERGIQIVGNAPEGFRKQAGPGITLNLVQGSDQRVFVELIHFGDHPCCYQVL